MATSTIEQKRMRQQQERFLRTKNKHPSLTDAQIIEKMKQEDFDGLPVERRFKLFESYISQAIQQLAAEMNNLRHNDAVLAEAMDVNFKSFAKILAKLGVSDEDQKKFIEEAAAEVNAARAKKIAELEASMKAQADEAEKAKVAAGVSTGKLIDTGEVDANGSPIPHPDGATVFGD